MSAHPEVRCERVGIYGGTFDPIHVGHLRVASVVKETLAIDRVIFVPARQSPHKDEPTASVTHRVAMVRLAVSRLAWASVSTLEAELPPPSFTVDTLRMLALTLGRSKLFLIVGADVLAEFVYWRMPEAILELATLVAVGRPGSVLEMPPALAELTRADPTRVLLVRCQTPDVSSRDIRSLIREGAAVSTFLPREVAAYVAAHSLYRGPASPAGEPSAGP